jgi:hypothetical protein
MFPFTIRDVLWLTVVMGLAVGWFVEHRATERRFAAQAARIAAQEATHKKDLAELKTVLKSMQKAVQRIRP